MAANQTKKPKKSQNRRSAGGRRTAQKPTPVGSVDPVWTGEVRTFWAVVLLLLSIFSALCWFQLDGLFLRFLEQAERGLTGWGWWSWAPSLLLASGQLFFHRGRPVRGRTFCALTIPALTGALAHTLFGSIEFDLLRDGFPSLWQLGGKGCTGGVVGGAAAVVFSKVFSRAGAAILLLLLAVGVLLVLTRTTPQLLADRLKESHEQYRQALEEQGKRHFWEMSDYDEEAGEAEGSFPEPEALPTPGERRGRGKRRMKDYDLEVDDPQEVAQLRERQQNPAGFQPMPTEGEKEDAPARAGFRKRGRKEKLFDGTIGVSTPDEYLTKTAAQEEKTEPAPAAERKKKEKVKADQQVQEDLAQAAAAPVEDYHYPSIELLKPMPGVSGAAAGEELKRTEDLLSITLNSFGIEANIVEVTRGPSVTRYDLELERGIKLSKVTNLARDIALSLGVEKVRIAPVPGRSSVVGIEVPNRLVSPVAIRSVIDSPEFRGAKSSLTFAVGKDIASQNVVGDIVKMPHLLIAGTTGSGKSVCTNSMIISLLYKSSPKEVRLIMIDPKMVELSNYNGIPHLLIPVVTDPKKAAGALQWAVYEMMQRYQDFADLHVREIKSYNAEVQAKPELGREPKPKIVIFIDELADLMIAASKEVEEAICRVAQMGRAAGMHLVIATQRPSTDVITGLMKANIPSRIALAVASSIDSRIILDTSGAEDLVGNGDMLFAPLGKHRRRVQGCFISDEEVNAVIEEIKSHSVPDYSDDVIHQVEENAKKNEKNSKGASALNVTMPEQDDGAPKDDRDALYNDAVEIVLETGMASASMLQRRLKLGYSRASRIVDQMEEYGVIGPFEGSKPRKVLISKERWNEMKLQSGESGERDEALELAKSMSESARADEPPFDVEE